MNRKLSTTNKARALIILILFMIVLCAGSFYFFSLQVDHLKRENMEIIKSKEYEQVYTYIEALYKDADKSVTKVAQNIIDDLYKEDLDSMKADLDKDGYSEKMYNILINNTETVCLNNLDNRRNGIIIATQKGILEDYYILRGDRDETDVKFYTFDQYYKNAYNKNLTETAVESIRTHSTNGLLVMESFRLSGTPKNHDLIPVANYDTLRKVYLEEGLDGFKNYQFQSVEYITDTGDIFGQKDIVSGHPQDNYKIIIIQEFNVYDQLMAYYPDVISNHINSESSLAKSYDWFNVTIILIAVIFIICVIAAILLIMSIYNAYINGLKYTIKNRR